MQVEWTTQQRATIYKILDWIRVRNRQVFRLYGYAGTGKTTLLKYLAANYNIRVAAYTGKAALVLQKKGCGASTIHSMIYRIVEPWLLEAEMAAIKAKGPNLSIADFMRLEALKKILSQPAFALNPDAFSKEWQPKPSIIAIDEASMVNEEIGCDLLSFGIPLLVVMDPAQLPPIDGSGYFLMDEPDVMLTEIHRQALDSGIIRMATMVRQGTTRLHDVFGSDAVVTSQVPHGWYNNSGLQLLCGRNKTRFKYNTEARAALGFNNELPVVGDKLCCWRNNHSIGLLNGSFWRVLEVNYLKENNKFLWLRLQSEDNSEKEIQCQAHKRHFLEADLPDLTWGQRCMADEFNYGYALTVHKAQGSEWDDVVLIDESYLWGDRTRGWRGGDRNKWLYTGITRASNKLTVVKT